MNQMKSVNTETEINLPSQALVRINTKLVNDALISETANIMTPKGKRLTLICGTQADERTDALAPGELFLSWKGSFSAPLEDLIHIGQTLAEVIADTRFSLETRLRFPRTISEDKRALVLAEFPETADIDPERIALYGDLLLELVVRITNRRLEKRHEEIRREQDRALEEFLRDIPEGALFVELTPNGQVRTSFPSGEIIYYMMTNAPGKNSNRFFVPLGTSGASALELDAMKERKKRMRLLPPSGFTAIPPGDMSAHEKIVGMRLARTWCDMYPKMAAPLSLPFDQDA